MKRIALAAAAIAALAACGQKTAETQSPQITEKVFDLAPGAIKVKSGIVGGELTNLRVTERVEEGTGRVDYGPKLAGRLVLRNLSSDQSVLIDGGKLVFADGKNAAIPAGPDATPAGVRLGESYNTTSARLDPGQELARDIDVDFPGEALKPGRLQEIRLQLKYTAAPFKRDLLEFPVRLATKG